MYREAVTLLTVPTNVLGQFRTGHAGSRIVGAEKCNVSGHIVFYAIEFLDGGRMQESLLSPEGKVVMEYPKAETPPHPQLVLAPTVGPTTQFRLFRRGVDGGWGESTPIPRDEGMNVVRAVDGATLWDVVSHAPGGAIPGMAFGLDWSVGLSQRKTHAIWLCQGNRLVWHTDAYYEVPREGWEVLDKLFPTNK